MLNNLITLITLSSSDKYIIKRYLILIWFDWQHLQAFQFNESRDESFFELRRGSDGCQRPPVELAASQFTEVQGPRCLW